MTKPFTLNEEISTINHTIKNNITALKAYAHLLKRAQAKGDEAKIKHLVESMDNYIDVLHDLITDAGEQIKIRTKTIKLLPTMFDLNEVLRKRIDIFNRRYPDNPINLPAYPALTIRSDRAKVEFILDRLLTIASYLHQGQTSVKVTIRVEKQAIQVRLTYHRVLSHTISDIFAPYALLPYIPQNRITGLELSNALTFATYLNASLIHAATPSKSQFTLSLPLVDR